MGPSTARAGVLKNVYGGDINVDPMNSSTCGKIRSPSIFIEMVQFRVEFICQKLCRVGIKNITNKNINRPSGKNYRAERSVQFFKFKILRRVSKWRSFYERYSSTSIRIR